jgi:hypothetical protein
MTDSASLNYEPVFIHRQLEKVGIDNSFGYYGQLYGSLVELYRIPDNIVTFGHSWLHMEYMLAAISALNSLDSQTVSSLDEWRIVQALRKTSTAEIATGAGLHDIGKVLHQEAVCAGKLSVEKKEELKGHVPDGHKLFIERFPTLTLGAVLPAAHQRTFGDCPFPGYTEFASLESNGDYSLLMPHLKDPLQIKGPARLLGSLGLMIDVLEYKTQMYKEREYSKGQTQSVNDACLHIENEILQGYMSPVDTAIPVLLHCLNRGVKPWALKQEISVKKLGSNSTDLVRECGA